MFTQFKKYLTLNILSAYGYYLWLWWFYTYIAYKYIGILRSDFGISYIPRILDSQYLVVGVLFILFLIELLLRKSFKALDNKLNINISAKLLYGGLIMLALLPVTWWVFSTIYNNNN